MPGTVIFRASRLPIEPGVSALEYQMSASGSNLEKPNQQKLFTEEGMTNHRDYEHLRGDDWAAMEG
jgi:hypothetical protein